MTPSTGWKCHAAGPRLIATHLAHLSDRAAHELLRLSGIVRERKMARCRRVRDALAAYVQLVVGD
jgi:hypothetical protein